MEKTSRRRFLQLTALAAGGTALAACTKEVIVRETVIVKETSAPEIVKETVIVEGKAKEVTKIVKQEVTKIVVKEVEKEGLKDVRISRCGWMEAEIPFDATASLYNTLPEREQDRANIRFDPAGKSMDDPLVAQMMASGEVVPWNAANCITPFLALANVISLGTGQPFEPLINASQYKDAAERINSDMMASVRADVSFEGTMWWLPMQCDVVPYMYRKDQHAAAGFPDTPATMDEALEIAKAVKAKVPGVFGFGWNVGGIHAGIAALHQVYTPKEKLFTADGLLNVLDDGWLAAMEMLKKFVDAGVCPDGWEAGSVPVWNKSACAAMIDMHGQGTRGAMIWGYDKLAMVPIPLGNPDLKTPGTMFWASCSGLFKAAPYPQEVVDYYVYAIDPKNEAMARGVFKGGKLPGFKSEYDFVDPADVTKAWALTLRPLLEAATPPPVNKWYGIEFSPVSTEFIEFLHGKKTAKEAMTATKAAIDAEVAKAK